MHDTNNYHYDLNGNLTTDSYNPAGHLRRVRHRAGSSLRSQFNYEVDKRGNRTRAFERLAQSTTVSATYNKSATQVTFTRGTWTDDGAYKKTTQFSGRMQIAYTGDEALLTVGVGPDHGIIDISINGWFWRSFNTYTAQPGERVIHLPQVTTPTGETSGTLEIRNRSDRHHRSTGYVFRFKQLAIIDTTYNERTIDYTYDGLSRLLTANYDGGAVEYTYGYDLAGNLTNNNGKTRTYNATNQLTNDGTHTLTYDANGNLTNDGTSSYTWDHANRLKSLGTTTYSYDGLGNRVQQAVGTTATNYLLDLQPGLTKVIGDSDGNRYVHSPRGIHAMQNNAGEWSYMAQDGLGSVRSLIDATLGVDSTHTYDPYGNYISTAPIDGYFGFTGELRDANGQLYLRARYYNPSLGVFNSLDPFEGTMQRPMSLNGYGWVEGNTPNVADPSGMVSRVQDLAPGDGGGSSRNRSLCTDFLLGGQWRDYAVCLSVQGFSYCPQGWHEAGINSSGYLSCRQNGMILPAELLWPDQADKLVGAIDFGGSMFDFSILSDIAFLGNYIADNVRIIPELLIENPRVTLQAIQQYVNCHGGIVGMLGAAAGALRQPRGGGFGWGLAGLGTAALYLLYQLKQEADKARDRTRDRTRTNERQIDIALGLTGEGSVPLVVPFAALLTNQQRLVLPWEDWSDYGLTRYSANEIRSMDVEAFEVMFMALLESGAVEEIHVNLEGIEGFGNYTRENLDEFAHDFMGPSGTPFARELYVIEEGGLCDETTFYEDGSTNPREVSTSLCG